jgi:hypothetical protein
MQTLLNAVDMVTVENFEDQAEDYDNSADYEPDEENEDPDEPLPKNKRARKEEIQWTEKKEYVLVCAYKSEKAYLKTKGMNMEQKRLLAFNKVREHAFFKDDKNLLTAGGVQAKFTRLEKAITAKYALTGEGANLSGLPEKPPRVDEALYKMIKEKLMNTVQVRKGKQKEVDRNIRLKNITDSMLQTMVRKPVTYPTLIPAPPAVPSSTLTIAAGISGVSDQHQQQQNEETISSDLTSSSLTTTHTASHTTSVADNVEEKWLALMTKREARRAEQSNEPSLQSTMMELERKRTVIEEQRLTLEEQRIQVDKMNAENNRKLFELLASSGRFT